MMKVSEVIERLPRIEGNREAIPAPPYYFPENPGNKVGLAVESMSRHMTDEGWQLFQGLAGADYFICGKDCPIDDVNVDRILHRLDVVPVGTVVIQDKREWMGITADRSRDPRMRFTDVDVLRSRNDIFKVTVVKDAQHDSEFHREAAEEIGAHAWIVYYNPDIVCRLAPYLRREHVIRMYHTVDSEKVPAYSPARKNRALLSGAVSPKVYPLRSQILSWARSLPSLDTLPHPGYHRRGCCTPHFIRLLSQYKVSICTASIYGYALRKIIESTAAGCIVITDLPEDETLPYIDGNLARVPSTITREALSDVIQVLLSQYNPERQEHYAAMAKTFYDYRVEGVRLAASIERLRREY